MKPDNHVTPPSLPVTKPWRGRFGEGAFDLVECVCVEVGEPSRPLTDGALTDEQRVVVLDGQKFPLRDETPFR